MKKVLLILLLASNVYAADRFTIYDLKDEKNVINKINSNFKELEDNKLDVQVASNTYLMDGDLQVIKDSITYITSLKRDTSTIEADITAIETNIDTVEATYLTNSSATATYLQQGFFDRGDPSAADFTQADLTMNGSWINNFSLATQVPAGAKAVVLEVTIKDGSANQLLMFSENGNSNGINVGAVRTQVANVYNDADLIIALDSDRRVSYWGTAGTDEIYITVKGWFK